MRIINYVDDTLYFGTTDEAEEEFIKELKSRFKFNLLGKASWYLGMKIEYNPQGATIDQQLYAKSIVNKLLKKKLTLYQEILLYHQTLLSPKRIVQQTPTYNKRLTPSTKIYILDQS